MKIAILGSTGFVGKKLLERALDRGYEVKTLVRTPEKLGIFKERVEFIQGNVFNAIDIEKTVKDTDIVLSTIGPPQRNPGNPEKYRKTMENVANILEKQKINRYIHIGGAAHLGGENESWSVSRRFLRLILLLFSRPILAAKEMEWDVLKKSNLDWTLVRPPQIIKGTSKGRLIADERNIARTKVNVEDLANFILDQTTSNKWVKKSPLVSS